jgi:simple sugar transport system ATP-binding protein
MLRVCSRLIVMKDREIVGELSGDLSEQDVMQMIAQGGH